MLQETSPKLRFSKPFVTLFSIATFGLGFTAGSIPSFLLKKELSDVERVLWATVASSATIIGALSGTQRMVSQDIEDAVREASEKIKEESKREAESEIIGSYAKFEREIEKVLETIESSSISADTRDKILEEVRRGLLGFHERYVALMRPSQKVASFLSEENNQASLISDAIEKVKSSHSLSEKHLPCFTEDLKECIHWLQYCIKDYNLYEVETDRYTSSVKSGMTDGASLYTTALTVFKDRMEEVGTPGYSDYVSHLIDYLIQKIFPQP
ncbi:MAG: V-type ATP synthase subunit E [Tildeniella nuda ZEHNDER 1965/U140]|jgi:hypothetical protein|nr:V-type ATP synthase subunit E [Tildeniella nuda ZEHNDER 1965/U140]